MIMINSVEKAQDILDLALEVQEIESCGWKEALGRAIHLHPRLQAEIVNDLRYGPPDPPIEIHTSWSIPPRQIVDLTVPAAHQIVAVE